MLATAVSFSMAKASSPGEAAPDFTAPTTTGEKLSLSDLKGKVVVLEWINFDCPFVKKHYNSGNLPKLQKAYMGKDVQWISVNSSAEGNQGYLPAEELAERAKKEGNKASHIILDTDGKIGKAYDAKTSPQIVVIDAEGKVAYNGAIDSIASTSTDDVDKAEKYAADAIDAVLAGEPVKNAKNQPYGCGVKYKQ